jgi:hypothetical protein
MNARSDGIFAPDARPSGDDAPKRRPFRVVGGPFPDRDVIPIDRPAPHYFRPLPNGTLEDEITDVFLLWENSEGERCKALCQSRSGGICPYKNASRPKQCGFRPGELGHGTCVVTRKGTMKKVAGEIRKIFH